MLLFFLFTSSCSIHNPPAPGSASSYDALCGTPEPCLKAALLDKKRGEPQAARTKLLEMRRRFPDTVWSGRASFLLGIEAVEAGDEGAASYLDDAGRLQDIKDYLLFYRARALRAQKKPIEAASIYGTLPSLYPASTLLHEALYEKTLSLEEAGDIPLAKKTLGDYISAAGEGRDAARALLKTAEYEVRMNEEAEAIKALRGLLTRFPSGPLAKDAEEMKRAIISKGAVFPDYTAEELWTRARAFFDAADYKNSASEFSALLKRTGPGTEHYGSSSILLALSQIRLKRYPLAEKTLRNYLEGEAEKELDALYWLSFALLRQENGEALMETERTLSERFPQSRQRAEVMLFIARLYESRGELRRALEAYQRVRVEFAGGKEADEARWETSWINYRSGRFTEAYGALKGLYISAPRRAEGDKYLYWAARSAGNLGNGKEASSLYGKVCSEFPNGFYCMLSNGRAGLKAESGIKDGESASRPPRGEAAGVLMASSPYAGGKGASMLNKETHYLAAVELLTLGLNKEAAVELRALDGKYPDKREYLLEVAKLFQRAGDYYRALRISRRYSPSGPMDETAYKELIGISYPLEVIGEVMEHQAPEARVDPKLVASIMREESEFNPEAVSSRGALGLMQITPATGETIASALMGGEKGAAFDPRGLLTPSVSIRFGSWYLGQLSKKFKGDLILTIAGYNAGPAAASRWRETRPPEDDEFIESIPYSETRLYVKKVLNSYGEYLRLSGMDRDPLKRP